MPERNGKYVIPPAPKHEPLPPGVKETDPEAHDQRHREYEAQRHWLRRLIVELAEVPKYCPRKACRRAGACASPTVVCHDETKEILRAEFYPRLREALRRQRGESLYDPDAIAAERARKAADADTETKVEAS